MTELSPAVKRALAKIAAKAAAQPKTQEAPSVKKPLVPLPVKHNGTKVKELCANLINEVHEELSSTSLPSATRELDSLISPLLVLSDLHFGEHIVKNGEDIFNFDIATRELCSIVDKACLSREVLAWNQGVDATEFNILLAGDIIDGELIFPAQGFETDGDAYSQFQRVAKVLWALFERVLAYGYKSINVFCVPGNHGRMSKIHSQMSNWDNALYYMLAMMAQVSPLPIHVTPPKHMWLDFKIRSTNIHTRHIGVSQASTAGPGRKILNWILEHQADLIFFGHFHNPEMYSVNGCRVFKNGSLPPVNDYAENLGFADGRGQWFVGISDSGLEFSKILQASYEQ